MAELGGDAACWLHELCPECGAVPDDASGRCWRCGFEPQADVRGPIEIDAERP